MTVDPYEEGGLPAHVRLEQRVRAAAADEKQNRWFTPPAETDDTDSWALTYLDVVTLLLTLFVALMARATLDAGGASRERPASLQELAKAPAVAPVAPAPLPPADPAPETKVEEELPDALLQGLGDGVLVRQVKGGVELRIQDSILFEPGKAALKPAAHGVLDRLVTALMAGASPITVEGHTDDVPISSGRFPSNWELSSARASAVVRYLIEQGVPARRLRAVGYADTSPVASNETDAGRASNRRVSLLLSTAL
ncbi:MAG: hypothetical protein AMXMBFR64_37060 [Myxococcales bacterium]